MTDELDRLKAALQQSEPEPDKRVRDQALLAAKENFERLQGTTPAPRPIPDTPQYAGSIWKGIHTMLAKMNLRPVLYATTCLVFVGVAFVAYNPTILQDGFTKDTAVVQENNLPAPMPEAVVKPIADLRTETATASQSMKARKAEPAAEAMIMASPQMVTTSADMSRPTQGIIAPPSDDLDQWPGVENNDTFAGAAENPVKITAENPVSTFSIDVDTASYAYIRNAILQGRYPSPETVRIEEMVNYFPYDYAAPEEGDAPFATHVSVMQTPWNPDTKLIHIGIQGKKPAIENRPPLNLVFLIDTSGSMQSANKLPLLKQSFRLLLSQLRPEDQVAIVTYAGSAGTVLEPTSASETRTILDSLNRLEAGGSTAGQAGLQQAYALAEQMAQEGEIGRVLLATDGDFNVGISDPDALKKFVERKRETGIYLSVFGFGQGNYRDDMMQSLAQNGNGTAAYIDTLAEAQKVLVDQVSGALFPIANDVKIQVEFNPALIAEYRLIGYETRILNREDFNNDKVDAGEIGAGHSVTALYEVTPVGSPALRNDPLRYQTETVAAQSDSDELGFLKLRYKTPGQSVSKLITTPIRQQTATLSSEANFAASIAGFGQLLKRSNYIGSWTFDDAIKLATTSKGEDRFGYRAEAIRLMQLAKTLR